MSACHVPLNVSQNAALGRWIVFVETKSSVGTKVNDDAERELVEQIDPEANAYAMRGQNVLEDSLQREADDAKEVSEDEATRTEIERRTRRAAAAER